MRENFDQSLSQTRYSICPCRCMKTFKEMRELLAPPLQEIELLSLEMVFKRRFGPLLRHYLQNISREVVLTYSPKSRRARSTRHPAARS